MQWTLRPRKVGKRQTNYYEMVEIIDADEYPVAIAMTDCFDGDDELHNRLLTGETVIVELVCKPV